MRQLKRYKSTLSALVILLLTGIFFSACSTEKDAFMNRWFHGINAHYNGYFNAKELIKSSLEAYDKSYQDDYTQILPIYVIPDEENKSIMAPDMNTAIEKVSIVLTRHSMPSVESGRHKKDEYNKWIDDNWLVMGQAYFYMRDYDEALQRFDYIIGMFKEDDNRFWAKLWKVKALVQLEKYDKATSLIKEIEQEEELYPKHFKGEFYTVQADMKMKQGKYQEAADILMDAIDHTKKKKTRARLTFILAQIYEMLGDGQRAMHFYTQVVKLKPEYEMEFYARIFKALAYSGGSSEELKKELNKMLDDDKNIDYRDQIYYALADIAFKEGDEDLGIQYLQLSAASSIGNTRQKAESYLRLADLYFDKKNYVTAQAYYDSTITYLSNDYPGHAEIKTKGHSLDELVGHINTVAEQDSLLKLASMDSTDVVTMVERMIRDIKTAREERAQAERDQMLASVDNQQNNQNNSGSTWYFYNQSAKAYGFTEFRSKFGERELEDNWRRKNKATTPGTFDDPTNGEDSTMVPELADDSLSVMFYLQHIPFSDSAMAISHDLILNALYDAGVIYRDKLFDNNEAIKMFEELIRRYDSRKESVTAHYQLYRIYGDEGNTAKADYHKSQITTRFPDSEPAIRILNPNLAEDTERKRQEDEDLYNDVYKDYLYKQYNQVLLACNDVINNDPLNHYIDRYYFLKAMAISELEPGTNTTNFEKALSVVVEKFPDLETGQKAEFILNNIRNKTSVSEVVDGSGNYIYSSTSKHFFIVVFPNSSGSINQLKTKFSDMHTKYFPMDGLKTESYFLDSDNQIIKVSSFSSMNDAMDYYNAVSINSEEMQTVHEIELIYFAISDSNFSFLFSDKNVDDYLEFFNENYLNE